MADNVLSERQRLEAYYQEVSDEGLLKLSAKLDELSDDAQRVLPFELKRRGLVARLPEQSAVDFTAITPMDEHEELGEDGLAWLTHFMDGHQLALACDALAQEELEFKVTPPAPPRLDESGPQYYELWVDPERVDEARAILRRNLGLFPLQEIPGEPRFVATGDWVTLGDFERKDEAEEAAGLLKANDVTCRIEEVPDDDGVVWHTVEVRDGDLDRGVAIVAEALGIE